VQGIFATWQPCYADHGIATFPVRFEGEVKKPAVKSYLRLGISYSYQLAFKFQDADAFGFALGKRTRITVLDVDTTCERTRDDAFARFGESPVVVRTLRGHWQGWYRHNGERRTIKLWPGQPIDVLGAGYVVAPPSQGPSGRYTFVQGGLDDIDSLYPLRGLPQASAKVDVGQRNNSLWRHCMRAARHCDDFDALLDVARTFAEDALMVPLSEAEIVKTARSAWNYEITNRNLFGRGAALIMMHEEVDELFAENPDALLLLLKLRRHHWGRDFVLANAMATSLGWGLPRFKAARDCLMRRQHFRRVHAGGRGPNDPPRFQWAKKVC
jgi:hypothetical protein